VDRCRDADILICYLGEKGVLWAAQRVPAEHFTHDHEELPHFLVRERTVRSVELHEEGRAQRGISQHLGVLGTQNMVGNQSPGERGGRFPSIMVTLGYILETFRNILYVNSYSR